ncbi:MAG: malate dehydrogenase [Planctomycetota bacterium]|jgi:malate dehydrogenase|nr:malate dehydrogenase [Planctomycetota bacterium]MDP6519849.1 malate dehydrogenase [Planctomycetota bacterium]MDP6955718.1 malate dehydrogenase [Planctomycetota bacterium]
MQTVPQRKLTVVGAGYVGSTCAQLAAMKELAAEVVLIDVLEGRPQGIALDLCQSAAVEGFGARVVGTNDPADTAGSDVVIMTAGRPRKPGMSRSDLLEVNGAIVREVATYVRNLSPEAIVIVVTNPLDTMVSLMRHHTGFPARRVIGMAGVLDSSRFSWFIAEATGASVQDVDAMVMGAHGDSMVPLPQYCTVNGVRAGDLVGDDAMHAMADRTRKGGAEIVGLLKTGSAWYAPASSAVAMAASILNNQQRLLPCACLLNGQFGFEGLYMGVPAVLGENGVERIVEVPLSAEARAQMQQTAGAILNDLEALRDLDLM